MAVEPENLVLAALLLVVAALYSSVGQAGASGYLAAMALVGVEPEVMKPAALVLNVIVSSIALVHFARAGAVPLRLVLPATIGALPLAFVGGRLSLPPAIFDPLVGSLLLFAAWRLARGGEAQGDLPLAPPAWPALAASGGAVGFLAGLTGIGGGILLGPMMLQWRWASAKEVAGASAAFNLVTSIAGVAGVLSASVRFPPALAGWAGAVAVGALVGAGLGSRRLEGGAIRRLLAIVLAIAGAKMIVWN